MRKLELEKLLKISIAASVYSGNLLKNNFIKNINLKQKQKKFFYEENIINFIKKKTKYQDYLSEFYITKKKSNFWVIDAIDGANNYFNGLDLFATSNAFYHNSKLILGSIYNPIAKEILYSHLKNNVFLNNKKLTINKNSFSEGIYAISFSAKEKDKRSELKLFHNLNKYTNGCLRTGSVTYNLLQFCSGSLNGCIGHKSKYSSVAAGLIIAQNLGARIKFKMRGKKLVDFVIGNQNNFDDMLYHYNKYLGKL